MTVRYLFEQLGDLTSQSHRSSKRFDWLDPDVQLMSWCTLLFQSDLILKPRCNRSVQDSCPKHVLLTLKCLFPSQVWVAKRRVVGCTNNEDNDTPFRRVLFSASLSLSYLLVWSPMEDRTAWPRCDVLLGRTTSFLYSWRWQSVVSDDRHREHSWLWRSPFVFSTVQRRKCGRKQWLECTPGSSPLIWSTL